MIKGLKDASKWVSEPSQTSKMQRFAKIVKGLLLLTFLKKLTILDVWLGFEYASVLLVVQRQCRKLAPFPILKLPGRSLLSNG